MEAKAKSNLLTRAVQITDDLSDNPAAAVLDLLPQWKDIVYVWHHVMLKTSSLT